MGVEHWYELGVKERTFYDGIKDVLEVFADVRGAGYIPWHQDEARFLIEWPRKRDLNFTGLVRVIQINIEPSDEVGVMKVSASVFSDKNNPAGSCPSARRLKSFAIFKGILPRDKDSRLLHMLIIAHTLIWRTVEEDLLDVGAWQEEQRDQRFLFDRTK